MGFIIILIVPESLWVFRVTRVTIPVIRHRATLDEKR
jgi:hypothetical protein